MWEFNRSERKALLLAAALIGLAVLGRMVGGPGRSDASWVPQSPRAAAGEPGPEVDAALRREARASTPLAAGERLDPNRVPLEELRRLPGIGPTRARAIVEERARSAFETPEDIQRVPGIGPATYARIAPFLTVEGRLGGTVPGAAAPDITPTGRCTEDRVDVNSASEAELRALSGIGPVLAGRIVRDRALDGGFDGPRALLAVSGIGPRLLERLRNRICFSR